MIGPRHIGLASVVLASACATAYQPRTEQRRDGYAELRLGADRWWLEVTGNVVTHRSLLESHYARRASELCPAAYEARPELEVLALPEQVQRSPLIARWTPCGGARCQAHTLAGVVRCLPVQATPRPGPPQPCSTGTCAGDARQARTLCEEALDTWRQAELRQIHSMMLSQSIIVRDAAIAAQLRIENETEYRLERCRREERRALAQCPTEEIPALLCRSDGDCPGESPKCERCRCQDRR